MPAQTENTVEKQSEEQVEGQPEGQLEKLRRLEFEAVRSLFKPGLRVLDVGGGNGYQARLMAQQGCEVTSIDLPGAPLLGAHFPVQEYDGKHIPADDASFDLIFSSNVLEHVSPLSPLLEEMWRTLKPGGLAIHVVPSAVWRFWTSLASYPYIVRTVAGITPGFPSMAEVSDVKKAVGKLGAFNMVKRGICLPFEAHGEYHDAAVELYTFSRSGWKKTFSSDGFAPRFRGSRLFYTGFALFPNMPIPLRRVLARCLGSSSHVVILRKAK
jgi:SAM-dependent methyltransferase